MTDAEIEALRDEMRSQRSEICAYLERQGVDVSGWEKLDSDGHHEQSRSN